MTSRPRSAVVLPALVGVVLALGSVAGCGGSGTPQATASSPSGQSSSSQSSSGQSSPSAATPTPTPSSTPTSTSPSPTTSGPSYRPCSQVWVAGQRLRGRYYGCTKPDGTVVKADNRQCKVGHDLETYANHFYAQETGKIFASSDVRHDPKYAEALALCKNA